MERPDESSQVDISARLSLQVVRNEAGGGLGELMSWVWGELVEAVAGGH